MKYIIFFLIFFTSFATQAQENKLTKDYPVKPGSKEWASFTTSRQMFEACQIPQNVLEKLSTKDLSEICINYPLFIEFTFFEDEREGISIMIERFNGLKELSKRKDGVQEIVNLYKDYPVSSQIFSESSKDYFISCYRLLYLSKIISG